MMKPTIPSISRRRFVTSLGAAALMGSGVLAQAPKPKPAGQRVFVMGHSFHMFVAERLRAVVEAAKIQDHVLAGQQGLGGSRVIEHWNLAEEKNLAKRALSEGKVDVITMSPNWIVPDEGIEKFLTLGLEHNSKLRVLVQFSWMPWDGWLPEERVPSNEARDARSLDVVRAANAHWKSQLEPQLRALNEKIGREVIHIAPVGDAVLKLRELVQAGTAPGLAKQTDLFSDQIGHPKAPIAVLATYCIFTCIYGVSPVGLADAQPELDQLSPELKPLLQNIAWEAVTTHPLSGVRKTSVEPRGAK